MIFLTNILYWVSTSLLIPTIVILLIFFISSLLLLGKFYGQYMNRIKHRKTVNNYLNKINLNENSETEIIELLKSNNVFAEFLKKMFDSGWRKIHSEKIIADFELSGEREIGHSKTLMRTGPMLGLMGTLIPMGPALVGLASGDIASMAVNLQVAFSTTVVGIFIGAIGFMTQLFKQRWYIEDINNLQYIYELNSNGK